MQLLKDILNYSIIILKSFNNYRQHARGFPNHVHELSRACSRVFKGWLADSQRGRQHMTRSVFEFELNVVFELIVFDYIFSAVHEWQKCGDRIAFPRESQWPKKLTRVHEAHVVAEMAIHRIPRISVMRSQRNH